MNRDYLIEWSLELDDDAYAQALAALGALAALAPARLASACTANTKWQGPQLARLLDEAIEAGTRILPWQVPTTIARTGQPALRLLEPGTSRPVRRAAPPAALLASLWQDRRPSLRPRLAVRATPSSAGAAMALARVLAAPAVRAEGVFIDQRLHGEGQVQWRWPFTVASLPGDPLAAGLHASLNRPREQELWPYRHALASREAARFEILLLGTPLADALARVLASPLALRCGLVLVAGLGSEAPGPALPLALALAERLSAGGVALVDAPPDAADFARAIDNFAVGLTHNLSLDVALLRTFGTRQLLLADRRLLTRAQVDAAITQATQRLRRLPPDAAVMLSPDAFDRLGVPPGVMTAAKPPPATGAAPPEAAMAARPAELAEAVAAARPDYPYEHEKAQASAVAELESQLRTHERAARGQAGAPRYVQQRSFCKQDGRFREERQRYVVGRPVLLDLFIGPLRADSVAAPEAFPEHKLPRSRDPHRLQLVLHEPRQFDQPQLREISLPRQGDSSTARFVFTPRAPGPFNARVTVLHRGRVLQTVLLRTLVTAAVAAPTGAEPGITLAVEAQVHRDWSDLGSRRQFDLAMVLNHTPAGEPMATGVAGGQAWAVSLGDVKALVAELNDQISKVGKTAADYGDGLDQGKTPELLHRLARIGRALYNRLYGDQRGRNTSEWLRAGDAVQYLQLVSVHADALVPLEFIYDFEVPPSTAPSVVCPQHREALRDGCCPAGCARAAAPTDYVCPMGFWGLKKVIERQHHGTHVAAPAGAQAMVQTEAVHGRDQLDLSSGALVGHSTKVAAGDMKKLMALLKQRFGPAVALADDWKQWSTEISARRPALLVAFAHNEGQGIDAMLEMGGQMLDTLNVGPLSGYVRPADDSPAPVLLLIGCDVVGTAQDYSSHVPYFREGGAAVVVTTIAEVLNRHAVAVGEVMVRTLLDQQPGAPDRIGERVRNAKRAALLKKMPMALCVVAFGDADWKL
ncbi:MAG TPA: hypothetical protein PKA16_06510 [Ottowia sp.]|uniref:hypothetical protein n=1 Tax=Ottowia sp. TaxID=1898956 RepID=UPI002C133940|nr:hypothetical protein [Ottowia sp.]HMN21027.1 hypothetical protein [Ottowia sp.]